MGLGGAAIPKRPAAGLKHEAGDLGARHSFPCP
jgi:hypothetical protein